MNIDPRLLNHAITCALDALAKHEADFAGESQNVERYKDFIQRSIVTAPDQYTGDDWRGDVSLPYNAVAQLLSAIHALQLELRHTQHYVDSEQRLQQLLTDAWTTYTDPHETNRNLYAKKALDKLGFKRMQSYRESLAMEYEALLKDGNKPGAAREILGRKYKKDPETLRQGLKRRKKRD